MSWLLCTISFCLVFCYGKTDLLWWWWMWSVEGKEHKWAKLKKKKPSGKVQRLEKALSQQATAFSWPGGRSGASCSAPLSRGTARRMQHCLFGVRAAACPKYLQEGKAPQCPVLTWKWSLKWPEPAAALLNACRTHLGFTMGHQQTQIHQLCSSRSVATCSSLRKGVAPRGADTLNVVQAAPWAPAPSEHPSSREGLLPSSTCHCRLWGFFTPQPSPGAPLGCRAITVPSGHIWLLFPWILFLQCPSLWTHTGTSSLLNP